MREAFRLIFDPLDGAVIDPRAIAEARFILRWMSPHKVAAPYRLAREMGISPDEAVRVLRYLRPDPAQSQKVAA